MCSFCHTRDPKSGDWGNILRSEDGPASGSRSLIPEETQSGFASGVLEGPVLIHQNRSKDIIGIHMKKIILATVLAGIGSTAALAADLGARTYTKAPAMAPVSNWSGWYAGLNAGWAGGANEVSTSGAVSPASTTAP